MQQIKTQTVYYPMQIAIRPYSHFNTTWVGQTTIIHLIVIKQTAKQLYRNVVRDVG